MPQKYQSFTFLLYLSILFTPTWISFELTIILSFFCFFFLASFLLSCGALYIFLPFLLSSLMDVGFLHQNKIFTIFTPISLTFKAITLSFAEICFPCALSRCGRPALSTWQIFYGKICTHKCTSYWKVPRDPSDFEFIELNLDNR